MPKLPAKEAARPLRAVKDGETPGADEPPVAEKVKAAAKKAPAKKAATPKLLAKAKPLTELHDQLNGLWCGDQGTGKTTDVLSMANLGRVLLVNAEGGAKHRALRRRGINVDNIVVLPEDPADLSFEYLRDLAWEIKADLASDPTSWTGGVWDSISDIHRRLLKNVSAYLFERATNRGESRVSTASPGDAINESFTDRSDYGVMTNQMVELLKLWHDIPMHFAVTALLRRDKDDDGKVAYRPAVTPALSNELMGLMDIVCVTQVAEMDDDGDDEYRGLFRPSGKYRGKDRESVLPKWLIDPTFDRCWDYVTEKLTVEDDPVMQTAKARRAAIKGAKIEQEVAGTDDETADEPEVEEVEA